MPTGINGLSDVVCQIFLVEMFVECIIYSDIYIYILLYMYLYIIHTSIYLLHIYKYIDFYTFKLIYLFICIHISYKLYTYMFGVSRYHGVQVRTPLKHQETLHHYCIEYFRGGGPQLGPPIMFRDSSLSINRCNFISKVILM